MTTTREKQMDSNVTIESVFETVRSISRANELTLKLIDYYFGGGEPFECDEENPPIYVPTVDEIVEFAKSENLPTERAEDLQFTLNGFANKFLPDCWQEMYRKMCAEETQSKKE